MKFDQDIAITEVTDKTNLYDNYISFTKGFYQVSELDVKFNTPNITIASRQNNVYPSVQPHIAQFSNSLDLCV